jgi:hypothetical protein
VIVLVFHQHFQGGFHTNKMDKKPGHPITSTPECRPFKRVGHSSSAELNSPRDVFSMRISTVHARPITSKSHR